VRDGGAALAQLTLRSAVLHNWPYLGILGTTVLDNLFFWGHVPFIQVIADEMGTNASEAGTLRRGLCCH
jgi:hypothetical protein